MPEWLHSPAATSQTQNFTCRCVIVKVNLVAISSRMRHEITAYDLRKCCIQFGTLRERLGATSADCQERRNSNGKKTAAVQALVIALNSSLTA
jgi:hypothetical protein